MPYISVYFLWQNIGVSACAGSVVITPGLIIHPPFSVAPDFTDWLRSKYCRYEVMIHFPL